ncbi:MAG TPA: hypothetical protein VLA05_03170, partial [Coriobacteriia bacterium]|nr:hypothetical protein [Coriobacteriia bacterium]
LPWVLGQVGFLAGVVILPLAKRAKPVNERDEALLMMIALAAGVLLVTVGVEFLAAAVPPAALGVIGLVLHGANVWLAVTPLAPK